MATDCTEFHLRKNPEFGHSGHHQKRKKQQCLNTANTSTPHIYKIIFFVNDHAVKLHEFPPVKKGFPPHLTRKATTFCDCQSQAAQPSAWLCLHTDRPNHCTWQASTFLPLCFSWRASKPQQHEGNYLFPHTSFTNLPVLSSLLHGLQLKNLSKAINQLSLALNCFLLACLQLRTNIQRVRNL